MRSRIKKWDLTAPSLEFETEPVKTHSLGKINVIKPSALSDREYTVVGSVSSFSSHFSRHKVAVASYINGTQADVFEHIPFSKLIGYLPTDTDGLYIAVRKPRILLVILIAIFSLTVAAAGISCLLTAIFNVNTPFVPSRDPSDAEYTQKDYTQGSPASDYMQVVGITEISVTEDEPSVQLGNPSGNQVLFIYTVFAEDGKILYKSQMIDPGMAGVWNVRESFSNRTGNYEVTINVLAIDPKTGAELNSVKQNTRVTVY